MTPDNELTAISDDVASPAPWRQGPLVEVVHYGPELVVLDFEDAVIAGWYEEEYRTRIAAELTGMPEWKFREIAHGTL